jgi:hypothetical protein
MSVENTEANRDKCACPGCPSYDAEMSSASESLYCAYGASSSSVNRLGCICGSCVVHRQNNLTGIYYCIEGAAE